MAASPADHRSKQSWVWSGIFSYCMQQHKPFLRLWCMTKSGFYATTGDDQLSGWTEKCSKAPPKAKLASEKSHGYCLVVCCQSDPLQLSESWWNHYMWEVETYAQQMDEMYWKLQHLQPVLGQQKGPNSSSWQRLTTGHTINAPKVEWIGLRSSASSVIWPLTNRLQLQASQKLVTGQMLPQPGGGRKCFRRVHWILKLRSLQT